MATEYLATELDTIKGIISALAAAIFTAVYSAKYILLLGLLLSTSACGIKAGSFVAGSTSYLREANRGSQIEATLEKQLSPHHTHSRDDKEQLRANLGRWGAK